MNSVQISSAWKALGSHRDQIVEVHMRDLFADDPNRFARFSAQHDDLLLDYSKNRITEETLGLLIKLAAATGIEDWRRRMFAGDKINTSEDRAVLHAALRDPLGKLTPSEASARAAGELDRMRALQKEIRSGNWTNIIHIGIGGSYLGTQMATAALAPYATGPHVHYVSNVDGTHLMELLAAVEQEEAVAEKTAALQGGDYDGYALAGEVMGTAMAEAFAANMNKMAADEAPEEEVDLSQISAADLLDAIAEMEQEEGQAPLA